MARGNGGGSPEGITVGRISIKVSPDTREFRRKLKEELEEIERTIKGDVHVTAHLDSAQARADFARMKEQMQRNGRIKLTVDTVQGKDGVTGKGGKGKDGSKNVFAYGSSGGGVLTKLFPNFGTGINPGGYLVMLTAAVALAAPLIGLLSTTILAIPGLISAVATPFAAIALGMEGIKKAATTSGFINDEGGLGPIFDSVKAEVSKAFEDGLTPALKELAGVMPRLLESLPQVATGLTDVFKGFTDALTSERGIGFFNEVVKNLGAAMSASAPGVRSFTDGMLQLTAAFSREFPGLTQWFNKTGDSFAAWIDKMTKETWDGRSPMGEAFKGLGDTLKTIGDWAIDLANEGMQFVQDPQKMQNFVATLRNIGQAIDALVALGNKLGPAWAWWSGDNFQNAPGIQKPPSKEQIQQAKEAANPGEPPAGDKRNLAEKLFGWIPDAVQEWIAPVGTRQVGEALVNSNISSSDLSKVVSEQIAGYTGQIEELNKNVNDRLSQGFTQETDPVIDNYKGRLDDLQTKLAEVQAIQQSLNPQVALRNAESPLPGAKDPVSQLLENLEKVPEAANNAKTAVAQPGLLTPEVLGGLSDQANAQGAEPTKIPPPDTSEFKAALSELPGIVSSSLSQLGSVAMQGVTGIVDAFRVGGNQIVMTVNTWPGAIASALSGLQAIGASAGNNLVAGMVSGINAGQGPVAAAAFALAKAAESGTKAGLDSNSPSKVFEGIGLDTAAGFAIGIDKGYGPVLDQAKDMAGKVAAAFADGTVDPTGAIAGYSEADIKRMEKALSIEMKSLEIKAKAAAYRGDKELAAGLRARKDELGLQKEMLDLTNEYNESSGGGEDPFAKALGGLMNSPVDFAKATGKQFLSDLGIGGDGFISKAITEGISYVFNIGSVDEALSIKDRQDSVNALSVVGR